MISIIIPAYNRADKIGQTLDSIIAQSEKDVEVIVVDDGSKDGTQDVLASYDGRFKQAQIPYRFSKQANAGAPAARNRGFAASTGEFLIFCDADSELVPDALATMKKTLIDNPAASYAYSSFYWGSKLFKVGPFSPERLKQGPFIHTMALIRRSDFPQSGWDEAVKKLQDWDLWLTMLEAGKQGVFIDRPLFRIWPGGTISSWLPSFAYKLLPFLPQVKKYKAAVELIKGKHKLS
ncbi:glycosyltransferase family 2 protein [Candidatus Falkowbacteria bacterium]|nr:glycosyltransferase family 2 protein [Candidatus Falkowbacteria bacterium]